LIASAFILAAAVSATSPAAGRIVVFEQTGSAAARDFDARTLPQLRALATERGVALEVRDAASGAPAEVHVTPLLVYQDAQGRSLFRGRYSDLERFGQFLRTVKAGPLAGADTTHENMAVWRRGRAVVIAPIKITALSGTLPPRYDEHAFLDRARRAVLAGFNRFRFEGSVATGPSDRAFHMDFHPYRDAQGKLFISTAIYSGFNCVEPVFTRFDEPVTGTWTSFEDAFRAAGRLLEDEVAQQVVGSTIGDAFDPVHGDVPKPTWGALGLALPAAHTAARSSAAAPTKAVPIPLRWTIESTAANDPPRLEFRFAPPLDSYNGEVRALTGTIALARGGVLAGATGTIEASTSSVTMGNKTLDTELRDKILRVSQFPAARFTLDTVVGAGSPLAFGAPVPFTGTGRLEMLGASVPIAVNAQAEPTLAEDGSLRLDVRATFRLRLSEAFGVSGPDGPSPANDTLIFAARFRLKPIAASR
jgi:hypothetical protein